MSNYAYKDAKGQLVQIPVRYGDMSRQVAQILRKNSENTIPSAPFIACYVKDLQFDRPRLQDPTFISKIQIRERDINTATNTYINIQGSNYTVERIMPSPYLITFAADIWSTSIDQKLQIFEQICVFFNPSFEIQTTDNYIDWTSLSVVNLERQIWSSRTVPQGINEDIDILTMEFTAPVWITPPAKVRKLGIVTKIISNIFSSGAQGTINSVYDKTGAAEIFNDISPDASITITPGDLDLLVLNGKAKLVKHTGQGENVDISNPANITAWYKILDLYPGKFRANLSQLRFTRPDGNDTIAAITIDPADDFSMILNIDPDTVPTNTVISGRGTIDAVVNPETFVPKSVSAGTRYLILENINSNSQYGSAGFSGPNAWKNSDGSDFQAGANDIIEWNGSHWSVVFNSQSTTTTVYITNSYTGTQYKWNNDSWTKSYEGLYDARLWRLVL
jgi:hypothetical protein